jgi:hypothetical protein
MLEGNRFQLVNRPSSVSFGVSKFRSFDPRGLPVKIRKPTTLLAGACTLCIAAASGTVAAQVEPQVELAAQQESTVRVASRDYTLAATGNPFLDRQPPVPELLHHRVDARIAGSLRPAGQRGHWRVLPRPVGHDPTLVATSRHRRDRRDRSRDPAAGDDHHRRPRRHRWCLRRGEQRRGRQHPGRERRGRTCSCRNGS